MSEPSPTTGVNSCALAADIDRMRRLGLTVLFAAAALALAAAGFGALTSSAYRAQASAICAHGQDKLSQITPKFQTTEAQHAKVFADSLAINQEVYRELLALKPPAALAPAHNRALAARLAELTALAKVVKLPGGGARHDQATQNAWLAYYKLYSRMVEAWKALAVPRCDA